MCWGGSLGDFPAIVRATDSVGNTVDDVVRAHCEPDPTPVPPVVCVFRSSLAVTGVARTDSSRREPCEFVKERALFADGEFGTGEKLE